jgi:hypothetical protein
MKDIVGYEGLYGIEEDGRVWSYKNNRFKAVRFKDRYYTIKLSKDNIQKYHFLHRLIAEAYIPNPDNKPFVDHINREKTDNRIDNLRWVTSSENKINTGVRSDNKLGEKHISYCNNLYLFRINQNIKYSKCFKTLQEAINYRDEYLTTISPF